MIEPSPTMRRPAPPDATPPHRPRRPGVPDPAAPDATSAWAAVAARDRSQDGRFVFAVVTTGVYCRPSCPARRPRRENVRFFATPAAAEADGFRPCLRCRPADREPTDPATVRALAARDYLEAHLDETVTLERLAGAVGGSPHHLQRIFKRRFGLSPRSYVNARRLERLRGLLRDDRDVTTALYDAGFVSGSQLYAQSATRLGMTPGRYRAGGAGVRVRFATAACDLGRVLVAATDRGICAVRLGDQDRELEEGLRREFPRALIEPAADALEPWLEAVLRRIEGDVAAPELPLDVRATAFQRRVWEALLAIPPGEVRTYGELAATLGRPGAARAVARACATNPAAIVVPCHRVVAAGGGLGGYRWGSERKERLLARERDGAADG